MPKRARAAQMMPKSALGRHRLARQDHQCGPAEAQGQTRPAPGRDAFAHKARGDQGDEDGLQADHDGHGPGRGAGFERDIAQAEIDDLDQKPHHRHIDPVSRRSWAGAGARWRPGAAESPAPAHSAWPAGSAAARAAGPAWQCQTRRTTAAER